MKEIKCPNCGTVFQVNEQDYSEILKQIKNKEFDEELHKQLELHLQNYKSEAQLEKNQIEMKKDQEIQNLNNIITNLNDRLNLKDQELKEKSSQINASIESLKKENDKNLEIANLQKQKEIDALKQELDKVKSSQEQLVQITKLESEKKNQELINSLEKKEQQLVEKYTYELSLKDDEIEKLKNFKLTLGTKNIGEDLEGFCYNEFNKYRALAFPRAYFEKDNEVIDGAKGDFIYRDYTEDGKEFISIMFEMKNESLDSKNRHKNSDFFSKLDKDRKNKNCEYAVLVSMLEADNELYNGITDVSFQFPKMYVIRPQFLIPMITVLRNTNQKVNEYKEQLELIEKEEIDVKNFEAKLQEFKDKFGRDVKLANDKFTTAISSIDKSIKELEKVKENLLSSMKYLERADVKSEELSVKKLVYNNPTMAKKFSSEEKE